MAALAFVTLFADDLDAVTEFYRDVFGFPEIEAYRSPIFRALDAKAAMIGFHAHEAYGLLGLDGQSETRGIRVLLNFEVDRKDEVPGLAARAVESGGRLIKAPYETYYGSFQAVLADTEGNVFRINKMGV